MVVVEHFTRLSDRCPQTSSETFPNDAVASIRSAVETVPGSVFENSTKYTEIDAFDAAIVDGLPRYEYEGNTTGGYKPNGTLWSHLGFNYSVDLYDAADCIAFEVEKSRWKNISGGLLNSQKGYRTQQDRQPKSKFGFLVVPVNYRGSDNLYQHSLTKLDFMKSVVFIDDVDVLGYHIPEIG